jgi:hypothetical protein
LFVCFVCSFRASFSLCVLFLLLSSSFSSSSSSSSSFFSSQWMMVTFVFDWYGQHTVYINGVQVNSENRGFAFPVNAQVLGNPTGLWPRPYCRLNTQAYSTNYPNFQANFASFNFYLRPLTAFEVALQAQQPPPNIQLGTFNVTGVPPLAQPGSSWQLYIFVNLTTNLNVYLGVSVTAGATLSASTFNWGGLKQDRWGTVLTISPTSAASSWNITFNVTGPGAAFYAVPRMMMITAWSFPLTYSTAVFRLNTSSPPVHAGWTAGAAAGSGLITFDQTATQYLDLMNPADTGGRVMPAYWGGVYTGITLSMWFNPATILWANPAYLSCNQNAGSAWAESTIYSSGTAQSFDIQQYKINVASGFWYSTSPGMGAAATFVVNQVRNDTVRRSAPSTLPTRASFMSFSWTSILVFLLLLLLLLSSNSLQS